MSSIETMRPQERDSEERRDPLDVFREFIACLDRAAQRQRRKAPKPQERGNK